MQRILQLEDTIDELHKLSSNPAAQAIQNLQNAGLNPVPVAPAQPIGNQWGAGTQGAAAQAPAPAGSPVCDHGLPMRFVAAGISKAGKPYKACYACPNARESACNKKVAA